MLICMLTKHQMIGFCTFITQKQLLYFFFFAKLLKNSLLVCFCILPYSLFSGGTNVFIFRFLKKYHVYTFFPEIPLCIFFLYINTIFRNNFQKCDLQLLQPKIKLYYFFPILILKLIRVATRKTSDAT